MSSEALPIRNRSSSNSHDASWGGAPGTSSGAAASWVPGRMSAWCVLTASGAYLRSLLQKVVKTSSDRPGNRKATWTKGCTAVIFRYQSRPNSSASARTERGGRGEGVFATETAVSGSQSARCEPHRLPPDPRGSFGGSSQPAEARAAGAAGGIRRRPWSVVIFIGTPDAFRAADAASHAFCAADTASHAFCAADATSDAFRAADAASHAFCAADAASDAFRAADAASDAFRAADAVSDVLRAVWGNPPDARPP